MAFFRKKKKKTRYFSLKKFIEDCLKDHEHLNTSDIISLEGWALKLDGKSEEEINKTLYLINKEWWEER